MAYRLEGSLLEVCDCNVLCPCWIGEDPDNGTCDSALAYRFDTGTIDGVDVSGLSLGLAAHIPGNVLKGNFRVILWVYRKKGGKLCRLLLLMLTVRFWVVDDLHGVAKLLLVRNKTRPVKLTGDHPFD